MDAAKGGQRLKAGDAAITHKMAYAMALPLTVALTGGITTYLATGNLPKGYDDYFHPQSGAKDQYGRPERWRFASYWNDVEAFKEKGMDFPTGTANWKLRNSSVAHWLIVSASEYSKCFGILGSKLTK